MITSLTTTMVDRTSLFNRRKISVNNLGQRKIALGAAIRLFQDSDQKQQYQQPQQQSPNLQQRKIRLG